MKKTRINPNKDFNFVFKVNGEIKGDITPFYHDALMSFTTMVKAQTIERKKYKNNINDYKPVTFSIDKLDTFTKKLIETKRIKTI